MRDRSTVVVKIAEVVTEYDATCSRCAACPVPRVIFIVLSFTDYCPTVFRLARSVGLSFTSAVWCSLSRASFNACTSVRRSAHG